MPQTPDRETRFVIADVHTKSFLTRRVLSASLASIVVM